MMRTTWVLDHPAHVRLLAPFIRAGSELDFFIATDRPEVRALLESSDGILPRRRTLWVERPIGKRRRWKAFNRMRKGFNFMSKGSKDGNGRMQRIVSIGAPLELLAYRDWTRLVYINKLDTRIYITDTEVNHLAHKLALKGCTHVVLPTHWDQSLDGGLLKKLARRKVDWRTDGKLIKVERIDGLHGHIHLKPSLSPKQVSDPPRVVVRRLIGDGIHDDGEVVNIPERLFEGLEIISADENAYSGDPWKLDKELAMADGVITNSVTLASEAVILGTPTLLISKAKRGFLNRLERDGYPLFRWQGEPEGEMFEEKYREFLAGLHLTAFLNLPDWPNARQQLAEILQVKLLD